MTDRGRKEKRKKTQNVERARVKKRICENERRRRSEKERKSQ